MDSVLKIKKLVKKFGSIEILKNIDIEINKGDFLVLVGPSGCGKSTLLNCIAGLEEINEGKILIDNKDMCQVPPKDRNIAMVFQSYALYPTMTVEKNITFGMQVRKLDPKFQKQKLNNVSKQLQIDHLLDRKPSQLSGGQRQRVAMGRALVREPELFLFDEPLSNLDAKLRVQMRTEIKRLHQKLNASIVYVTHDQIEAMTLATKIVVLKDGLIQQIGTPSEIYNFPANLFVADFMGSPSMNLVKANVAKTSNGINIKVNVNGKEKLIFKDNRKINLPEKVIFGVRPENIFEDISKKNQNGLSSNFQIDVVEPAGSDTYVVTNLGGVEVTARFNAETSVSPGEWVSFKFDTSKISYFDPDTGRRLN
jgi:multiple sugar transport system ATP-binding protein